jgi:hypothetical protein
MTYLDKTFCASPHCTNECGRRMTDEEHHRLVYLNDDRVSYGYFCGEPEYEDIWKDAEKHAGIIIIEKK